MYVYLTNLIPFIIAQTTVNQTDKNLPTDAETIVQGAINGSEIFVSAFDNDWKLFASGQNPVYVAIVNVSMLAAVVLVSFWSLQWYEQIMSEGFSSGVIKEMAFPMMVILMLNNNGAMLATTSLALRNVSNKLNSSVLTVTRNGITLKEAIRSVNTDQTFILAAKTAMAECEKLADLEIDKDGNQITPKKDCKNKVAQEIDTQASEYKQKKRIQGQNNWNPLDVAGGAVNTIVQGLSYIIFSGLSAAFQFLVQFSFLLTAYVAPIFLVLSMLPIGAKPIFAWLSGWLALTLILMSYSIIVGVAASSIVNSPSNNPLLLQLIEAIFSPILAVAIGTGGGMALFSGFTSAAKFVVMPRNN